MPRISTTSVTNPFTFAITPDGYLDASGEFFWFATRAKPEDRPSPEFRLAVWESKGGEGNEVQVTVPKAGYVRASQKSAGGGLAWSRPHEIVGIGRPGGGT